MPGSASPRRCLQPKPKSLSQRDGFEPGGSSNSQSVDKKRVIDTSRVLTSRVYFRCKAGSDPVGFTCCLDCCCSLLPAKVSAIRLQVVLDVHLCTSMDQ